MNNNKDVSFVVDGTNIKFNYRVAGLISDGKRVFLQKNTQDNFYYPQGGRVKYLENSKDALIREIKEEVNIDIKKEDITFIDVIENFFELNGYNYHELLFVYKIKTPKELLDKDNFTSIDKEIELNTWIDLNKVKDIDLRPEELKKYL